MGHERWETRERRYKVIGVSRDVLVILLEGLHACEFVRLPESPEIPPGTRVIDIYDNHCRRCLDIVLENESWPSILPGCELERLDTFFATDVVWRRKKLTDTHERV